MSRESLFTCRVASSEGPVVTHIVAWGAKDAAEALRAELAAENVDFWGEIEVVPGAGAPTEPGDATADAADGDRPPG